MYACVLPRGAVGNYGESINPAYSINGIMVEQAKYEVLKKIGKIEIRRYPSLVIAKVDEYGDGGFNFLFRFIPSDNRQKLDIAMTAPVVRARLFVHNFISKKLEMEFFSEF